MRAFTTSLVLSAMLTITAYAQEASEPRPAQDIYYNMSVELAKMQERDKLACYREMAQHIAARQAAEAKVKELEAKLAELPERSENES